MVKLTVGELKEFLDGVPDNTEVRVSSVFNTVTEEYSHVSTCDISYTKEASGNFLILEPCEISIG